MRGIGRIQTVVGKVKATRELRAKQRWQHQINPTRETMPLFLVGNGRSGTSMLVYHLTRSWHIDLYNEDNPAAFEKWFLRDLSIIEKVVADSYAPITLFKPIKDTYRIHTLLERFPHAKALFSFRHFDDVINSSRKRFYVDFGKKMGKMVEEITPPVDRWMQDDFVEYAAAPPPAITKQFIRSLWHVSLSLESKIALHWLFVNSLYFDLELDSDPTIKAVRYESLVLNPKAEFKAICEFLTIPFEAKMVNDVFASSINKKNAPDLAPAIRAACEKLYQRLCDAIGAENEFATVAQGG
jgi:hypothetical protein